MSNPKSNIERTGLFPGSFDPITIAHVDIAKRAARDIDHLYFAVAVNPAKKSEFDLEERKELAIASLVDIANVEVITMGAGLTVDHARKIGATTFVRGMRGVDDFLAEVTLKEQNNFVQAAIGIEPDDAEFVETVTYHVTEGMGVISSSFVRGLMHMKDVEYRAERIKPLVPKPVFEKILPRLPENQ